MSTANELRAQANALLEQAAAIHGTYQYMVIHRHEYGESVYVLWTNKKENDINEDDMIPLLESEYEPDLGETLTCHWIPFNC